MEGGTETKILETPFIYQTFLHRGRVVKSWCITRTWSSVYLSVYIFKIKLSDLNKCETFAKHYST